MVLLRWFKFLLQGLIQGSALLALNFLAKQVSSGGVEQGLECGVVPWVSGYSQGKARHLVEGLKCGAGEVLGFYAFPSFKNAVECFVA